MSDSARLRLLSPTARLARTLIPRLATRDASVASRELNDKPIILISPDMRPSVMGVTQSLIEANLLRRFVTTLAVGNGNGPTSLQYLPNWVRTKLNGQLKRREVPSFLNVPVETIEFPELVHLAARRLSLNDIAQHRVWQWAETSFDRTVAQRCAGRAPFLYGCEHASVETFKRQKEAGGANILWQVAAHYDYVYPLLREEFERYPEAVSSYQRHLLDSIGPINQRKAEQYAASDLIVTNSEFARKTFIDAGVPGEKVIAVPTGCPPVVERTETRLKRAIRFLSAGNHSIQKGTPYLLEAWKRLKPSTKMALLLLGDMALPEDLTKNLPENVELRPRVSASDLKILLGESDVLVLPTLAEGRAHIVLEALAAGLAIITTENSGCGDLVEQGVNGWRIPIRDSDALADRIAWCCEHPAEVEAMKHESLSKAKRWQVEDFMKRHAEVIREFVSQ